MGPFVGIPRWDPVGFWGPLGKLASFFGVFEWALKNFDTTPSSPSGLRGLPPDPFLEFEISFFKSRFQTPLGLLARSSDRSALPKPGPTKPLLKPLCNSQPLSFYGRGMAEHEISQEEG